MNCVKCKAELSEETKFCPNCGQAVFNTGQGILDYIDHTVRQETTFLSAQDFLNGAKPLKFRWMITLAGAIISAPVFCVGAIPAYIIATFMCAFKLLKLNGKNYTMPKDADIEHLANFLRQELTPFPFSQWQVGNPTALGLRDRSTAVIQCVFENRTVHRIVFGEGKSTCQIIAQSATTSQHIARGGSLASAGLLYKNTYRVQPILSAAIRYYFEHMLGEK